MDDGQPLERETFLSQLAAADDDKMLEAVHEWLEAYTNLEGDNLPELARIIFRNTYCESDVLNGGFHQLFLNSTGDYFEDFVKGYRLYGADELAAAVEEAGKIFPDGPSPDRDTRYGQMVALGIDEDPDAFEAVDDRFFKLLPPDKWDSRRGNEAQFVREHLDELWPPDYVLGPKYPNWS